MKERLKTFRIIWTDGFYIVITNCKNIKDAYKYVEWNFPNIPIDKIEQL